MSDLEAKDTDSLFPLKLTVERVGSGGITGLTPSQVTLRIRDASTLNSYLDFADNTFKTAGWTQQDAGLSEVGRGHYQYNLNVVAVPAMVAGFEASVEYHVDNGADIVGDDHDSLLIVLNDPADRALIAAAVRDVNLAAAAAGSLGEGILIARNGRVAYRLDNYVRNSTTGFADQARLRIFPDQATAAASTSGGSGEGELVSVQINGTPHGVFTVLPVDIVGG